MPSKKRKYNARFPAGRIKKIMQTDEEVGKVAQAVPIIISRTLELFVESLLSKAMQVTMARNAKTLSPSHVKQCILAEQRFDFLRDLVKNIPDVSAAEEKEMMSADSSPNTSRFPETLATPRKIAREDSNSSSGSDVKVVAPNNARRPEPETKVKVETFVSSEGVIDLSKKPDREEKRPNFYQETLLEEVNHRSVIRVNPTYASPQPSTSSYASLTPVEPIHKVEIPVPKCEPKFFIDLSHNDTAPSPAPSTAPAPAYIAPLINIDFSKGLAPQIKVLDSSVANIMAPKDTKKIQRQNSKPPRETKKIETEFSAPMNIDILNSGNLQIDEDYDT